MTRRRGRVAEEGTFSKAFRDLVLDVAGARPDIFPSVSKAPRWDELHTARLRLDTTRMDKVEGGLSAEPVEEVLVVVTNDPDQPPGVFVEHDRFVGVPHVLTHGELCIYLDPQREWDPAAGAEGFLNRLHDWFVDAVANRFDASTALYHPVGGRAHTSTGGPLVVCRHELDINEDLGFAKLARATADRLDLLPDNSENLPEHAEQVLFIRAPGPLFAGPGATLRAILTNLGPELAGKTLEALRHRVIRQRDKGLQVTHFVITVPNPASQSPYLLVGRLRLTTQSEDGRVSDLLVEWCPVDDQRASISTRRDSQRPVSAYLGRDVAVVGCGGLGSWVAEFLVRAGVRSLCIFDPATVKGGLLVRQNFTDQNVGMDKDAALVERLGAVAPDCDLTFGDDAPARLLEVLSTDRGLVVDATVSLAFGRRLDEILVADDRRAVVARVATDIGTGSLGMVVVSAAGGPSLDSLDVAARDRVLPNGGLEAFHTFWQSDEHEELVPAKGCSIPTFHGSAADMAAVSAEMLNLMAPHLMAHESGVHLLALPHSGLTPAHTYFDGPTLMQPSADEGSVAPQ